MTRSESIAKLLPALIAARAEFTALVKDSKNPHFNSKYADLAAVLDVCDGPLGKHGLAVLQIPVWSDGQLVLKTTLAHTSGEWLGSDYPVLADYSRPQSIGAALTYARRYSYMAVAGIAPEDDDGETASGRGHNGHASRPAPQPRQPTVAERNLASHAERGGPVARSRPTEAPNGWGNGNGHHTNGNGHTNGTAVAERPRRSTGDPTTGAELLDWLNAQEEAYPGCLLIEHITVWGKAHQLPYRLKNWAGRSIPDAIAEANRYLEEGNDPSSRPDADFP